MERYLSDHFSLKKTQHFLKKPHLALLHSFQNMYGILSLGDFICLNVNYEALWI